MNNYFINAEQESPEMGEVQNILSIQLKSEEEEMIQQMEQQNVDIEEYEQQAIEKNVLLLNIPD